jgi:membrane protein implicated in regulation of membrane protease activity
VASSASFGLFYGSARAWLAGADPYAVFRTLPSGEHLPNLNPPIWLLIFAPFTRLPIGEAGALWTLVSTLAFVTAATIAIRGSGWRSWRAYALLAGPVVWGTLGQEQVYAFPILAIAGAAAASHQRLRVVAGALLGLAVALKPPLGVAVICLFLVDRRLGITSSAFAAFWSLLPLPFVGPSAYVGWIHVTALAPTVASQNASLYAVAARSLGANFAILSSVVLILLLAALSLRRRDRERAFELGLCAALAASPITWPPYFGLLWPVYLRATSRRFSPVFDAALLVAATPEWIFIASGVSFPVYAVALLGFVWEGLRRRKEPGRVADDGESPAEDPVRLMTYTSGGDR